ncbi:MAG: hypothetical protein HEQ23_11745 [Tepidisphaera sp.]
MPVNVQLDTVQADVPQGPIYLVGLKSSITIIRIDLLSRLIKFGPPLSVGDVKLNDVVSSQYRSIYSGQAHWLDSLADSTELPAPCRNCGLPYPSGRRWPPTFSREAVHDASWFFPRTGFGIYVTERFAIEVGLSDVQGIQLDPCRVK